MGRGARYPGGEPRTTHRYALVGNLSGLRENRVPKAPSTIRVYLCSSVVSVDVLAPPQGANHEEEDSLCALRVSVVNNPAFINTFAARFSQN